MFSEDIRRSFSGSRRRQSTSANANDARARPRERSILARRSKPFDPEASPRQPSCEGFFVARLGGLLCTCRRPVFFPPRVVNVWTGAVCRVVHPVAGLKPFPRAEPEGAAASHGELALARQFHGPRGPSEGPGDSGSPSSSPLVHPAPPAVSVATFALSPVERHPCLECTCRVPIDRDLRSRAVPRRPTHSRRPGVLSTVRLCRGSARITRALRSRLGGVSARCEIPFT